MSLTETKLQGAWQQCGSDEEVIARNDVEWGSSGVAMRSCNESTLMASRHCPTSRLGLNAAGGEKHREAAPDKLKRTVTCHGWNGQTTDVCCEKKWQDCGRRRELERLEDGRDWIADLVFLECLESIPL